MQMARFYDRAGSAVIRSLGAERDRAGQVSRDAIAEELASAMEMQCRVPPGTVIVSGSGRLVRFGVKRVFHVAAVEGNVGGGDRPVPDVAACVEAVPMQFDDPALDDLAPSSMLLPLLGTGSGGAPLHVAVGRSLDTAVGFFERCPHHRLQTLYLQVFSAQQMAACPRVLAQHRAVPAAASDDGSMDLFPIA